MRAVIQKVKSASVTVEGNVVSQIGRGLVVLVGICNEDTFEDVEKLANTVLKLKLFESEDGTKMWQKSVSDLPKGQILSVSQFTLYGNVKKGSKPDFHRAAKGHIALEIYKEFLEKLKNGMKHVEASEKSVQDGVFGAMMDVALVNDGPVTINYDTKNPKDKQIESTQS